MTPGAFFINVARVALTLIQHVANKGQFSCSNCNDIQWQRQQVRRLTRPQMLTEAPKPLKMDQSQFVVYKDQRTR